MKKIGNKLMLTYISILLVVFVLSTIIFGLSSRRYLISETRKQLRSEGIVISKLLSTVNLEEKNIRLKLKNKAQLKMAGRLIDSQIVVYNANLKPVYWEVEDEKLIRNKLIRSIATRRITVDGYVAERINIKNVKGQTKGYLLVLTKIDDIKTFNKFNRQALIISLIISLFLALILGKIFERNLTKPIRILKDKMQNFSIKNNGDYEKIKTGDEIEELDNSFEKMAERIKQYDEQQKKFFQNTSHELKTPLMSIQGYAEAIKDGVVEGEELEGSLDIIIEESQRLKKTVDEIIYLTKLEDVKETFNYELNNISDILTKSIKATKSLANDKNIKINEDYNLNLELRVDKDKLLRAFINVIGNGIRYAENTITISSDIQDSYIDIYIKDDGIGFKEGEVKKIFERFYRGKRGITGLGLTITKAIIEGNKGTIKAYNNTPKGAVIKIQLPYK